MKKSKVCFIISCLFLCLAQKNSASHIYGGDITYTHVSGLTYQIDITLYTAFLLDRPTIDSVHIGGITRVFTRDVFYDYPAVGIRKSIYSELHTFPGDGIDSIRFVIPNRDGNIANIPNSFYTPFSVITEIIVSESCPNNSVSFPDLPLWYMQHNKIYNQSAALLNSDHDSLSFELVSCLGEGSLPIPGYFIPDGFNIDPISGEFSLAGYPDSVCEFAFAIKITEWKDGIKSGSVMRDFNIDIHPDTTTSYFFEVPSLALDTGGNYFISVSPTDTILLDIEYTDSSTFPELNVYGEALILGNPATININSGSSIIASAHLSWAPDSTHSRPYPYIFTFRGSNDIQKTDLTVLVYVDGPKPDSCYTSPIGIHEVSNEYGFTIYPNPTTNQLTIDSKLFTIDQIELFNSLGEKVHSSADHCSSFVVNCASFTPGIYIVKASSGEKSFFGKFIKE